MRYEVEPEVQIAKGCRCLSCWEQTGKWLVVDKQSDAEDLVFDSEEEAEEWVKQQWYRCARCDAGYQDQQCTCEELK